MSLTDWPCRGASVLSQLHPEFSQRIPGAARSRNGSKSWPTVRWSWVPQSSSQRTEHTLRPHPDLLSSPRNTGLRNSRHPVQTFTFPWVGRHSWASKGTGWCISSASLGGPAVAVVCSQCHDCQIKVKLPALTGRPTGWECFWSTQEPALLNRVL